MPPPPALLDDAARTPTLRTSPPPASLAARLWFGWVMGVVAVLSAVLSPPLVLHSAFRPTARTFVTWMRPWSRGILRAIGVRLRVIGTVPPGPVVFVANHQNALDIPATAAGLPRPFLYVARHELRTWPIVGWVLEKSACLFIRRDNPREALRSLKVAGERIRGGESVLLFPEGGRSYRHGTEPFMKGAFVLAVEAGVPLVPVALVGHVGVVDEKTKRARPGAIRLILCDPIATDGLRRSDVGELAEQVRGVIGEALAAYGDPVAAPAGELG